MIGYPSEVKAIQKNQIDKMNSVWGNVNLTVEEERTLQWLSGWSPETIDNIVSSLVKVITSQSDSKTDAVLAERIANLNILYEKYEMLKGGNFYRKLENIGEEIDILMEVKRGISDIDKWNECYKEDLEECGI